MHCKPPVATDCETKRTKYRSESSSSEINEVLFLQAISCSGWLSGLGRCLLHRWPGLDPLVPDGPTVSLEKVVHFCNPASWVRSEALQLRLLICINLQ
jgi:hypothetical protein